MKKWYQYKWVWVVVVLVILFLLFLKWYNGNKDNIKFDFKLMGNAGSILNQLQSREANIIDPTGKGIGVYLDVPITTTVSNEKNSAVNLKDIVGSISYNDEPILQTKPNSPALADVNVAKKDSTPVPDKVQVLFNKSTIDFFKEIASGNNPKIKYDFGATIFGIPYSFRREAEINKDPNAPINPNQ